MFGGFATDRIEVYRIARHVAHSGRAVLLVHRYPQTHVMWHGVAPELAHAHTSGVRLPSFETGCRVCHRVNESKTRRRLEWTAILV